VIALTSEAVKVIHRCKTQRLALRKERYGIFITMKILPEQQKINFFSQSLLEQIIK